MGADMRVLVVVDGDDTLWWTERLYDRARRACARLVARSGYDAGEWETTQRALDLRRSQVLGLSALRFPGSCALAVHAVTANAAPATRAKLVHDVRARAGKVFDERAQPRRGAAPLLKHIAAQDARLVLCTQGDAGVQRRRILDSGLAPLFDDVRITPFKSPGLFAQLAREANATLCLSIGNSPRSDIAPAVQAGYSALLVRARCWEREAATARQAATSWVARDLVEARERFDAWLTYATMHP